MTMILDLDPHRQLMLESYLQKLGLPLTAAVDEFLTALTNNGTIREIPDFVFERNVGRCTLAFCTAADEILADVHDFTDDHIEDFYVNLREVIRTQGRHRFIFGGRHWRMSKNANVRIRDVQDRRDKIPVMEFSLNFAARLLEAIDSERFHTPELVSQRMISLWPLSSIDRRQ